MLQLLQELKDGELGHSAFKKPASKTKTESIPSLFHWFFFFEAFYFPQLESAEDRV